MSVTIVDVPGRLDAAADHITEYGWVQDDWYLQTLNFDDGGYLPPTESPCCPLGAIKVVCGGDPDDTVLPRGAGLVAEALCKHLGIDVGHVLTEADEFTAAIGGWNAAEGRTKEEVVAAFRGAAKKAREAQS